MKKVLDILFRGGVFMAPKWALWIIFGGCVAAFGESGLGLDKATYTSFALVGLGLGIISIVYSLSEEKKEVTAAERERAILNGDNK